MYPSQVPDTPSGLDMSGRPVEAYVRLPLRGQLRMEAVCATAFFLIPVELSRLSASTSTKDGDHTTRLPLSALKALTLPPVACPPTACQRGYERW